jgi:hypothetical protein
MIALGINRLIMYYLRPNILKQWYFRYYDKRLMLITYRLPKIVKLTIIQKRQRL